MSQDTDGIHTWQVQNCYEDRWRLNQAASLLFQSYNKGLEMIESSYVAQWNFWMLEDYIKNILCLLEVICLLSGRVVSMLSVGYK